MPCQDTPGAKASYSAAVRVPADLTALMSAVPHEEADGEGGVWYCIDWCMVLHGTPVPADLTALMSAVPHEEEDGEGGVWYCIDWCMVLHGTAS